MAAVVLWVSGVRDLYPWYEYNMSLLEVTKPWTVV